MGNKQQKNCGGDRCSKSRATTISGRRNMKSSKKYQGLKVELEKIWGVKVTVVPVVMGALGGCEPQTERVAPADFR